MEFQIIAKNSYFDNWMSFVSWYSIHKHFPDSKVSVLVRRSEIQYQFFDWCYRFKVPLRYTFTDFLGESKFLLDKQLLIMYPLVIAVGDNPEIKPIKAQDKNISSFVDSAIVGKYIASKWINRLELPFNNAVKRFRTEEVSLNEMKVLKTWEKFEFVYAMS